MKEKKGLFAHIGSDLPAGIIVFLVALPLCLGIASASDASPLSGLIAGIVGGIVVAIISGSPLGVSGPAAGLAVIVAASINDFGENGFQIFLMAGIVAGIIQLGFGLLKLGVIGYYFPSGVIKGMLAGIGLTIILKQIPHALGSDKDPEGDFKFMQVDGKNTFEELYDVFANEAYHNGAIIIGVVSLLILVLWEQKFMKKISIFRFIQGPLVVVVTAIGLNAWFKGSAGMYVGGEHLVSIPKAIGSEEGIRSLLVWPDWSAWSNPHIYTTGFVIALVASLETLLCVEATDKLDPQKRITPTNRELIAQGTGNIVSSAIGGLPITQVIVRSSANIQSGGKTKFSAIFHGILLVVAVLAIPGLLNLIPMSALAAILFVVGYKLAKPVVFKEMYAKGLGQFIPFVVTIVGIIFTDLLVGIGLGLVVAIVQILYINYKIPYHIDPEKIKPGKPVKVELSEDVSFLNKASILRTLNALPDGTHIVLDGHKARHIHSDIIEIIEDFKVQAKMRNILVETEGMHAIGTIRSPEQIGSESDYKKITETQQ